MKKYFKQRGRPPVLMEESEIELILKANKIKKPAKKKAVKKEDKE